MENTHQYEVNLHWDSESRGTLSSPALPQQIEVAIPPEFPKGMPGIWSPEHLFVASVNACLMTTFLVIAENSKLDFIRFESKAIGTVEKVDRKYRVTKISLKPVLTIPDTMRKDRAVRILEMSEENCLISNSVNTAIHLQPQVITE
ncbi:MAG: OsmC family peroxiredoxin [Saprospirales bacterium]|nr:MAG: OsmC family peroxiredoxin [Saprospirales bacterium]